jgi:hypothetical protein
MYALDNSGDFMKLASLTIALTILLSSSSLVLAADKSSEKPKGAKQVKTEKAKKVKASHRQPQVALTGSYIKRNVSQDGVVTDGPDPVYVLDSNAIRNSGASDLRELLVFRGLNH